MQYSQLTSLLFVFALAMHGAAATAQEADVNLDDKLDSYTLMHGKIPAGKVSVQSKFVEEPMTMPVEITVSLQCFKGFRLKNFKRSQTFQAFDYGRPKAKSQLSSYDTDKQELTVYYWTAKLTEEQRATHDKDVTKRFQLKDVCAKE